MTTSTPSSCCHTHSPRITKPAIVCTTFVTHVLFVRSFVRRRSHCDHVSPIQRKSIIDINRRAVRRTRSSAERENLLHTNAFLSRTWQYGPTDKRRALSSSTNHTTFDFEACRRRCDFPDRERVRNHSCVYFICISESRVLVTLLNSTRG